MSSWINLNSWEKSFDGSVRLFPLPNFVLFPGVVKGLYIFEPRYCAMLNEALATDQLIAMALLKPGWEADYFHHPAIYETVCLGRITHHAPSSDGKHHILLSGLKRATIVRESSVAPKCFRKAHVELLEEDESSMDCDQKRRYQIRLLHAFRAFSPAATLFSLATDSSIQELPLSLLVDLLSQELPLEIAQKQALLAETGVERRIEVLLNFLSKFGISGDNVPKGDKHDGRNGDDSYPPRVSWN